MCGLSFTRSCVCLCFGSRQGVDYIGHFGGRRGGGSPTILTRAIWEGGRGEGGAGKVET